MFQPPLALPSPLQPALSKTYDELVLSCEDYNPAALPEEPELFDVTVVNNCSEAVRVKVRRRSAARHPPRRSRYFRDLHCVLAARSP